MLSYNMLDSIIAQTKLSKKETSKQQAIVETAITMFAEKGYANTSTSEIAKASGVAEATIFRHYGTKDNLLLSVILPFLKEFAPVAVREISEMLHPEKFGSLEDFLRAFLKDRIAFLEANKEIFRIVVKEFIYREELRKEFVPFLASQVNSFVDKVLMIYKLRGEIADLPNYTLKRLLATNVCGYFGWRFLFEHEREESECEAEMEHLITFIVKGLKRT